MSSNIEVKEKQGVKKANNNQTENRKHEVVAKNADIEPDASTTSSSESDDDNDLERKDSIIEIDPDSENDNSRFETLVLLRANKQHLHAASQD